MRLRDAFKLKYGDQLEHKTLKNADGTRLRLRVTGKVKTWKRDKTRIKVPLKHGLYDYGYLVNNTNEGGQFSVNVSEVVKT